MRICIKMRSVATIRWKKSKLYLSVYLICAFPFTNSPLCHQASTLYVGFLASAEQKQRGYNNSRRERPYGAVGAVSRDETNFPRGAITSLVVFIVTLLSSSRLGTRRTSIHASSTGRWKMTRARREKKGRNFKERTKRSPGDGFSGDLFKVPRPFDN